ncbi:hypothetical protein [Sorangium sp. So ce887]|uniref:hypothetical protein n=1 Tax=Sorangium sp. So ce887 TaxID=3133324 RepID=UPI003F633C30
MVTITTRLPGRTRLLPPAQSTWTLVDTPKGPAKKHLMIEEMVALLAPWVENAQRKRLFLSVPEIAGLHPRVVEAHETVLAVRPTKEKTASVPNATLLSARNKWLRVVAAVLSNLDLSDAPAEAIETIRGPVLKASERAGKRYAGAGPSETAVEEPAAPAAPAALSEVDAAGSDALGG